MWYRKQSSRHWADSALVQHCKRAKSTPGRGGRGKGGEGEGERGEGEGERGEGEGEGGDGEQKHSSSTQSCLAC